MNINELICYLINEKINELSKEDGKYSKEMYKIIKDIHAFIQKKILIWQG